MHSECRQGESRHTRLVQTQAAPVQQSLEAIQGFSRGLDRQHTKPQILFLLRTIFSSIHIKTVCKAFGHIVKILPHNIKAVSGMKIKSTF